MNTKIKRRQLLVNGRVFDGDELLADHGVLLADGRVESVLPEAELQDADADRVDLSGALLIPGFNDLQVNGGGGVLFNQTPTVEGLRRIGAAHRQSGTTGFLPTLITDDYAVMREAAAAVDEAMAEGVPGVLGIHFEGPFLNPERRGVHRASHMKTLDEEGFDILTSLHRGKTLVTLAPEIAGTEMVARLAGAGVVVWAGHTAADYAQTRAALESGLSGFTHLFNSMPPALSRDPGIVGAAIEDGDSWFGIIADGHHVHPAMVSLALRAKVRGGAVLVTDAMPTVGSAETSFSLHGETVSSAGGFCANAEGTLAGSDLDMLSAVNNAAAFTGIDWFEAVRMASLYPAQALGLGDRLGRIASGYRANFLILDKSGKIADTWINGEPNPA